MNTITEIQVNYNPKPLNKINTSEEAYELLLPLYEEILHYKELFLVLYLNRANGVLGYHAHSLGSDTCTIVSVKQVIAIALKVNACSIILSHNHPSGNLKPSNQDIELTKKIKEAAGLFEIKVLDHLIIGDGYYSFADDGLI